MSDNSTGVAPLNYGHDAPDAQTDGALSLAIDDAIRVAFIADNKHGADSVVLLMAGIFDVVDAFVITSGSNLRLVKALVDEIEVQMKAEVGKSPIRVEGLADSTWVLMDYGDFLVHVFLQETRDYYDLEHLWSGAPRIEIRDGVQIS